MRSLLIIIFLCVVSVCPGQEFSEKTVTLQEVLNTTYKNLSVSCNDSVIRNNQQQIKSTWHLMLYLILKHNELANYCSQFSDIERIAELRFKAGESDFRESLDNLAIAAGYNTEKDITSNEITICHNLLRQLAQTEYELVPSDSSLRLYEIDKSHAISPAVIDSSGKDAFSFIALENMNLRLDNLFIRLNYYTSFGLDYAETITDIARARFHAEDIDFYSYFTEITESLKIRLQYLDCLNNYNQSAIQLEYYAY